MQQFRRQSPGINRAEGALVTGRTFEELRAKYGDEIAMLIVECGNGPAGEALFAARIKHRNERITRDPRQPRPGFDFHDDGSGIKIWIDQEGNLQMLRDDAPVLPIEQVDVWLRCRHHPISAATYRDALARRRNLPSRSG